MNTIYLWPRHIAPFCRASFCRGGVNHILQFSSVYQSPYNTEQQHKILDVINDSSTEELSRFDISKGRINNLQRFRRKRGPFSTLGEVLEVDGLGVKVLEKLCNSILNNSTALNQKNNINESEITEHINSLTKRSKVQIVTPTINSNQLMTLQTAVGIHIGVCAVAWAHMDRSGNLLAWDIYNLEFGSKRLHLTSLFEVVRAVCDDVAKGDIYVLEDKGISMSANQQQSSSISIKLQNYQLIALFLALLNGSLQSSQNEPQTYEHLVFFLRSRLPARLFRTLVGSERVSAQSVVLEILSQQTESYNCSPICVSDQLKKSYLNRTAKEKESLCRALLLIMTFMDLVVRKNPASLKSIKNGRLLY